MSNRNLIIITSMLIIAAVLALSGCTGSTPQPTATPVASQSQYPMNVTDDYGRTVTLTSQPERIVSLSSENTEILFALGLGDRVVGDNDYDDFPAAAVNVTKVGGLTNVNNEKVISLSPDIIFANTLNPKDTITQLDSLGQKVIVNNITNISGIDTAILRAGKACNATDNATKLVNEHRHPTEGHHR